MIKGKVIAVCASPERGAGKHRVSEGVLIEGMGLSGDAHFGFRRRQVSLLSYERILAADADLDIDAAPGDFAENITTLGMNLSLVRLGSEAIIGTAKIRILERGKPEHGPGDYSFQGVALLAKEGLFAEVIESGCVAEGDDIVFLEIPNGRDD